MADQSFPDLGDTHRRGIGTTLSMLDESLCEFERWAKGQKVRSVLYEERNALLPEQREVILNEAQAMRRTLREVRDALALAGRTVSAGQSIWAACGILWQHLTELQGRHLHRYGPPPPGLDAYLDPKVDDLIRRLERISAVVARQTPVKPRP
jgi:hypothetical protein